MIDDARETKERDSIAELLFHGGDGDRPIIDGRVICLAEHTRVEA